MQIQPRSQGLFPGLGKGPGNEFAKTTAEMATTIVKGLTTTDGIARLGKGNQKESRFFLSRLDFRRSLVGSLH